MLIGIALTAPAGGSQSHAASPGSSCSRRDGERLDIRNKPLRSPAVDAVPHQVVRVLGLVRLGARMAWLQPEDVRAVGAECRGRAGTHQALRLPVGGGQSDVIRSPATVVLP